MSDLIRRAREALVDVTPGPWDAALEHGCHGIVASIQEESRFVAVIYNATETPEREPMRFANASFIAAARDLVPAMADRLEAQEALLREAMEALGKLHHAVCGETGFAQCVRVDSKTLYPWPALDVADHAARATLAKLRSHMGETE